MRITRLLLLLLLLCVIVLVPACWLFPEGPKARPAGTDGSARWAFDVASPRAKTVLAPDAIVVEITGEDVMPDGRLAANRGKWTLSFSSFTAAQRVPVAVDYLRNVTVGTAVAPGVIRALGAPPGTFPDSTNIFASSVGKGAAGARTVDNPVQCAFDSIAGTHVWTIKLKVGSATETHRVRWDGVWLEVL